MFSDKPCSKNGHNRINKAVIDISNIKKRTKSVRNHSSQNTREQTTQGRDCDSSDGVQKQMQLKSAHQKRHQHIYCDSGIYQRKYHSDNRRS